MSEICGISGISKDGSWHQEWFVNTDPFHCVQRTALSRMLRERRKLKALGPKELSINSVLKLHQTEQTLPPPKPAYPKFLLRPCPPHPSLSSLQTTEDEKRLYPRTLEIRPRQGGMLEGEGDGSNACVTGLPRDWVPTRVKREKWACRSPPPILAITTTFLKIITLIVWAPPEADPETRT